jgi:hypothetical protein
LISKLDLAGWPVVADRVTHGLCHELNGRANSLSNLAYLMTSEGSAWEEVSSVVGEEVSKLEEAVRLLRLLPDNAVEEGLLAPREFLVLLPRLVRIQPGLELVETVGDLSAEMPAIRMDETLFTRSLLLLLSGAGEAASTEGVNIVRMHSGADPRVLRIAPMRDSPLPAGLGGGPRKPLPPNMETLVGEVLKEVGGEVIQVGPQGGDRGLELRLPGAMS